MGSLLSFDFYGDKQLSRTLQRVSDNVGDMSPAWEAMAVSFGIIEARQFSSEGAASSGGWSPLSPKYGAWKAKNYPGQPIMQLTGALKDSLTSRPFGIESIEAQSMAIGSDNEIGGYHQRGDGNNPQRRVVELTDTHRRDWVQMAQKHLFGGGFR